MENLSVIGVITIPGQYDENGNELVAPVLTEGWHIITTAKLVGLDDYISTESAGREFAGTTTYHYVFDTEENAKSIIGYTTTEDGGQYTPVFQEKINVPQIVTMRQARLALLQAGLLSIVEQGIATMEGTEGDTARIEWEYAQEIERTWSTLSLVTTSLGLTEEQVDNLFILASTL